MTQQGPEGVSAIINLGRQGYIDAATKTEKPLETFQTSQSRVNFDTDEKPKSPKLLSARHYHQRPCNFGCADYTDANMTDLE